MAPGAGHDRRPRHTAGRRGGGSRRRAPRTPRLPRSSPATTGPASARLDLVAYDGGHARLRRGQRPAAPARASPRENLHDRKQSKVRRMAIAWLTEGSDRPYGAQCALRRDRPSWLDAKGELVRLDHLEGPRSDVHARRHVGRAASLGHPPRPLAAWGSATRRAPSPRRSGPAAAPPRRAAPPVSAPPRRAAGGARLRAASSRLARPVSAPPRLRRSTEPPRHLAAPRRRLGVPPRPPRAAASACPPRPPRRPLPASLGPAAAPPRRAGGIHAPPRHLARAAAPSRRARRAISAAPRRRLRREPPRPPRAPPRRAAPATSPAAARGSLGPPPRRLVAPLHSAALSPIARTASPAVGGAIDPHVSSPRRRQAAATLAAGPTVAPVGAAAQGGA